MGALEKAIDELTDRGMALAEDNKKLLEEVKNLQARCLHAEMELSEVKSKYDSLCSKVKKNANDKRNEGERFLANYAKDRNGPWN